MPDPVAQVYRVNQFNYYFFISENVEFANRKTRFENYLFEDYHWRVSTTKGFTVGSRDERAAGFTGSPLSHLATTIFRSLLQKPYRSQSRRGYPRSE
jgi:hypothetical protein